MIQSHLSRSLPKSSKVAPPQTRSIHHPFFTPKTRESVINVGIVGAGTNTKLKHIPNLLKLEGVQIAAVANRSRKSGELVAKQFNIPTVYDNWHELINDKKIDAIVIGTWPYMHKSITCAALEHNKHVLSEARMAMNAKEAQEMFTESQKRPYLVTQLVPAPYTLKYDATLRNLISSGSIGTLVAIDVKSVDGTFAEPNGELHWRQDFEKSGLNIMRMGIWYEQLVRWVGPASSVIAKSKVVVKQRKDASGNMTAIQIPDHLDILADMVCGAQARFQFSSVVGLPSTHTEVWIYGTEGTLHLDLDKGILRKGKRGEMTVTPITINPEDEGHWRVEEEFINAIRGVETISLTTFEDGVKYMQFTEAVWKSVQQRAQINLPLLTT